MISNSIWFEFISEISDKEGRFVLLKGKIDQEEIAQVGSLLFGFFIKLIDSKDKKKTSNKVFLKPNHTQKKQTGCLLP